MTARNRLVLTALALSTALLPVVAGGARAGATKPHPPRRPISITKLHKAESYPYGSRQFAIFVDDSYRVLGKGKASDFYNWMESAYQSGKNHYPSKQSLSLEKLMAFKKNEISKVKDSSRKAKMEMDFAAWMHRMIKQAIPKFSLDRGFEFHNTVLFGERQCFLQSVLIAGLLQDAGMDAGVVMVFRNPTGGVSNNGHATVLLKLPNSKDIIVDASDPEPFVRHTGLMVNTSDFTYVMPVYDRQSCIVYYKAEQDGRKINTSQVRTLACDFLRSQFYYYRGERVPGGLLASKKTTAGLTASERYLRRSVDLCPKNPLAEYMLARTYYDEGNTKMALKHVQKAGALYSKFGWIPPGLGEFISLVSPK